jgi:GNAT superfamily N-acetyltransferase
MPDSDASESVAGKMRIRPAGRDDTELLHDLIAELADYERLSESVQGDTGLLAASLFDHGAAEALIAEVDGEAVGYAVLFQTFSTFECRPGLWIEDLFIRPVWRRRGLGVALFDHIAGLACDRGCARVEWSVLDWNEPALRFYETLGATQVDGWRTLRLEGEALERPE